FQKASLDACTGHSFLYLVANRAGVLSEVRRVLRPGGRLVLMEPNDEAATVARTLRVSRDARHLVSISLWRPFSRLHGRFTIGTLTATLAAAGFVKCRVEATFGGLARPPPVNPLLLPVSLALKVVGWLLAAFVNLPFWFAYGAFFVLSIAYSHPRVRLKAHTLTSLMVVGFGQGALAFLAAWAAT